MIKNLIEEQKKEARNRVSGVTFNVINNPQTKYWFTKEDLDDFLTEALTLAYEAGREEERERILLLIRQQHTFRDKEQDESGKKYFAKQAQHLNTREELLKALTPDRPLNNEREV